MIVCTKTEYGINWIIKNVFLIIILLPLPPLSLHPAGSKAAPRPGGIGSAAAGQPGMEGESLLSKVLPGNPAEAAGKLGEGALLEFRLHVVTQTLMHSNCYIVLNHTCLSLSLSLFIHLSIYLPPSVYLHPSAISGFGKKFTSLW